MSHILLGVYHGEDTAEHVLGVLRAQGDQLASSLESAAIVQRRRDRSLRLIRTEQPRSTVSFWGVFWEALFGLIFRTPGRAPANDSNLAHLFGTIERAGLDETFRVRVRRALPGTSSTLALFALNWNTASVLDQVYLRPNTCIRASLFPEQEFELLRELGRLPPDDEPLDARPCNHPIGVVHHPGGQHTI